MGDQVAAKKAIKVKRAIDIPVPGNWSTEATTRYKSASVDPTEPINSSFLRPKRSTNPRATTVKMTLTSPIIIDYRKGSVAEPICLYKTGA